MKLKIIFTFPALLLVLQLVVFSTQAQNKVKKYCEVSYSYGLFEPRYKIDYGQDRKYNPLKDSVHIEQLLKVKSMRTRIDVLNYMSGLGWDFISIGGGQDVSVVMIFSREFDPAELSEVN